MSKIHDILILKGNFLTSQVWANGEHLSPEKSIEVFDHMSEGFSWGYAIWES